MQAVMSDRKPPQKPTNTINSANDNNKDY